MASMVFFWARIQHWHSTPTRNYRGGIGKGTCREYVGVEEYIGKQKSLTPRGMVCGSRLQAYFRGPPASGPPSGAAFGLLTSAV